MGGTGFAVHPLAQASALEMTATGLIVVEPTMRAVSDVDVYAIGDLVMVRGRGGKPPRMSCASGFPPRGGRPTPSRRA
ncbi:hypothetical protein ACFPM3_06425 [Streptomyces coeruleoprunus]|uniref:Uncharacterized protein n=1 Tax=Streptomyces coeruleoprunus TaxID=285563 RepID=A0ABV9X8J6_9ACTN